MNLYHLRYFSTLAHIEHYTKAADRVYSGCQTGAGCDRTS